MARNSYSIKFTPKAEEDLDEIYRYISEKLLVSASADNLMEKIEENITKLQYFPESGSLILDELLRKKGYRKLIVESYMAFYIVDKPGKQVIIMRILYGAMNYQDLL